MTEDKPLRWIKQSILGPCLICHMPAFEEMVKTESGCICKDCMSALGKLIAEKQEPSIPVKKIEEKIKDLEDILEMEKAEFPSGMKITPDIIIMQNEINNLKSLLPKK